MQRADQFSYFNNNSRSIVPNHQCRFGSLPHFNWRINDDEYIPWRLRSNKGFQDMKSSWLIPNDGRALHSYDIRDDENK